MTLIVSTPASAASVTGKIKRVFAGSDTWYGVRFYMNITSNQASGVCKTDFIYTEPKDRNGHNQKVAVFIAAHMAGKNVSMTVQSGRDGYCELIEGSMYDDT